jgi:hypothetical protein
MTELKLVYPAYYRLVERGGNTWHFIVGAVFYHTSPHPLDLRNLEAAYGTTKGRVAVELFRINGGKPGFYLANLKDKQYHYCGMTKEDVRVTLYELGIGRPEPDEVG